MAMRSLHLDDLDPIAHAETIDRRPAILNCVNRDLMRLSSVPLLSRHFVRNAKESSHARRPACQ